MLKRGEEEEEVGEAKKLILCNWIYNTQSVALVVSRIELIFSFLYINNSRSWSFFRHLFMTRVFRVRSPVAARFQWFDLRYFGWYLWGVWGTLFTDDSQLVQECVSHSYCSLSKIATDTTAHPDVFGIRNCWIFSVFGSSKFFHQKCKELPLLPLKTSTTTNSKIELINQVLSHSCPCKNRFNWFKLSINQAQMFFSCFFSRSFNASRGFKGFLSAEASNNWN